MTAEAGIIDPEQAGRDRRQRRRSADRLDGRPHPSLRRGRCAARYRRLGLMVVHRRLHAVPANWFKAPPFDDFQDYVNRSPITYIKNVDTPMMFILGDVDYRTPPQSGGEQMFRALKFLHKPTVMVPFPGRVSRVVAIGTAVAPRRTAGPHRGLVRQVPDGRDQAGVQHAVGRNCSPGGQVSGYKSEPR